MFVFSELRLPNQTFARMLSASASDGRTAGRKLEQVQHATQEQESLPLKMLRVAAAVESYWADPSAAAVPRRPANARQWRTGPGGDGWRGHGQPETSHGACCNMLMD